MATPKTNGFIERFNWTVLDEFFREASHKTFYAAIEELQEDLDHWLHHSIMKDLIVGIETRERGLLISLKRGKR